MKSPQLISYTEKLKAFSLRMETRQGYTLWPLPVNMGFLARAIKLLNDFILIAKDPEQYNFPHENLVGLKAYKFWRGLEPFTEIPH